MRRDCRANYSTRLLRRRTVSVRWNSPLSAGFPAFPPELEDPPSKLCNSNFRRSAMVLICSHIHGPGRRSFCLREPTCRTLEPATTVPIRIGPEPLDWKTGCCRLPSWALRRPSGICAHGAPHGSHRKDRLLGPVLRDGTLCGTLRVERT